MSRVLEGGAAGKEPKGQGGVWGEMCGVKVVAKMGDRDGLLEGIVPGAKIPPDTLRHPVTRRNRITQPGEDSFIHWFIHPPMVAS